MEERNVNTWDELKKELDDLRRESAGALESPLLFRGQENSGWLLSTTLDRKRERVLFRDYYRLMSRIKPQVESLTNREWPIPEYPEVEELVKTYYELSLLLSSGRCPGYAYMAYLRHHGFPSPLLDWTRSPYVAAYFAFSKAAEESNGRVSIFVFSDRRIRISGNQMPVVFRYGPYVKTDRRHFLQQSEYTLCLEFGDEWRFEQYHTVFQEGLHQQGVCRKFTVPATERRKVLKELDEYNVNAFSLFGSEESIMETLAAREFCFIEKTEDARKLPIAR